MDVGSVCAATSSGSSWPLVFVLLFATFLGVDVSITAFTLFRVISEPVKST